MKTVIISLSMMLVPIFAQAATLDSEKTIELSPIYITAPYHDQADKLAEKPRGTVDPGIVVSDNTGSSDQGIAVKNSATSGLGRQPSPEIHYKR